MNFNVMKNIISLISLVFLFNSCTTIVFMNRKVPPKLVLEKQPARIIFNNYFDYQANPEIKDKHEAVYKMGIEKFARALVDLTPPNKTTIVFLYDTTHNYQNTDIIFDTLSMKNDIISSCETNNADFLLSLDSLDLYFDWEVIREDQSDGSVSKTKFFYLFCDYYLTLYDSKGIVKQRNYLKKSCFYSSRPTLGGLFTIKPNLKMAKNQIYKVANDAGKEYLSLFYPSIENCIRELYIGKVFKETNTLIKSQYYNEAIILLQDLANNPNTKLAAKAQHNLNVAKELKYNNINTFKTD